MRSCKSYLNVYKGWSRWYKGEMIVLYHYTMGWLFKFGKFPYCLFVIPYAMLGVVLATIVLIMCPKFDRPPTPSAWLVRPAHKFMRGKSLRTDPRDYKNSVF